MAETLVYAAAVIVFVGWVFVRLRGLRDAEPGGMTAPAAAPRPAKSRRRSDDLTRIKGIGTVIAKKLRALGYRRFEDIAGWKKADLARIDAALAFKGRAVREKWVQQARSIVKARNKKVQKTLKTT